MGLNDAPSGERIHIGFFGRRNAGKSSVVNAVTNQDLAVVSDTKGTTTDPVTKAMELLPMGPVTIIDTPGFDDEGALGEKRVQRTRQVLNRTDVAVLVVDGAQSTPHIPVDVQALDADFFAFSGHKVYGPMGIGVLYGREELLNAMPPFLTGGEMIESVTRDGAVFAELPHKFEAGTVNAADAVGLHAAIDYVKSIGFTAMHQQEVALTRRAMDAIGEMPHVHVLGSEKPEEHCGIITFTVDGVHPHDISEILASDGVAIRAGHHCAQPLLAYLKHPSTARASLAFYNTESEVDRLLDSISTLRERMGYGK